MIFGKNTKIVKKARKNKFKQKQINSLIIGDY